MKAYKFQLEPLPTPLMSGMQLSLSQSGPVYPLIDADLRVASIDGSSPKTYNLVLRQLNDTFGAG